MFAYTSYFCLLKKPMVCMWFFSLWIFHPFPKGLHNGRENCLFPVLQMASSTSNTLRSAKSSNEASSISCKKIISSVAMFQIVSITLASTGNLFKNGYKYFSAPTCSLLSVSLLIWETTSPRHQPMLMWKEGF